MSFFNDIIKLINKGFDFSIYNGKNNTDNFINVNTTKKTKKYLDFTYEILGEGSFGKVIKLIETNNTNKNKPFYLNCIKQNPSHTYEPITNNNMNRKVKQNLDNAMIKYNTTNFITKLIDMDIPISDRTVSNIYKEEYSENILKIRDKILNNEPELANNILFPITACRTSIEDTYSYNGINLSIKKFPIQIISKNGGIDLYSFIKLNSEKLSNNNYMHILKSLFNTIYKFNKYALHRDIKMQNITINKKLEVSIIDLGLTIPIPDKRKENNILDTSHYNKDFLKNMASYIPIEMFIMQLFENKYDMLKILRSVYTNLPDINISSMNEINIDEFTNFLYEFYNQILFRFKNPLYYDKKNIKQLDKKNNFNLISNNSFNKLNIKTIFNTIENSKKIGISTYNFEITFKKNIKKFLLKYQKYINNENSQDFSYNSEKYKEFLIKEKAHETYDTFMFGSIMNQLLPLIYMNIIKVIYQIYKNILNSKNTNNLQKLIPSVQTAYSSNSNINLNMFTYNDNDFTIIKDIKEKITRLSLNTNLSIKEYFTLINMNNHYLYKYKLYTIIEDYMIKILNYYYNIYFKLITFNIKERIKSLNTIDNDFEELINYMDYQSIYNYCNIEFENFIGNKSVEVKNNFHSISNNTSPNFQSLSSSNSLSTHSSKISFSKKQKSLPSRLTTSSKTVLTKQNKSAPAKLQKIPNDKKYICKNCVIDANNSTKYICKNCTITN